MSAAEALHLAGAVLDWAWHHPKVGLPAGAVIGAVLAARSGRRRLPAAPSEVVVRSGLIEHFGVGLLMLGAAAGGLFVLITHPWKTAARAAAAPHPTVTHTTIITKIVKAAGAAHPWVSPGGIVIIVVVAICVTGAVLIVYRHRGD